MYTVLLQFQLKSFNNHPKILRHLQAIMIACYEHVLNRFSEVVDSKHFLFFLKRTIFDDFREISNHAKNCTHTLSDTSDLEIPIHLNLRSKRKLTQSHAITCRNSYSDLGGYAAFH